MSSVSLIDSPADRPEAGLDSNSSFDFRAWFTILFLQLSHRLGAVALLATLGTWAILYQAKNCTMVLAAAGGTAEAGLCFALIARMMTRSNPLARREAGGVAIFNLVLFILAIYLMAFTRMDDIRTTAGQFFSPAAPPQVEQHW